MENKSCEFCGNNPVPHFTNWYFESINILFTPLRQVILYNPITRAFKKAVHHFGFGYRMIELLLSLGIITYQSDISRCKVSRAVVLWEEAAKRGIVMKELLLLGKPFDTYSAEAQRQEDGPSGNNQAQPHSLRLMSPIIFTGLPRPVGYDNSSLDLLDDKGLFKRMMLKAGLPTPAGGTAWTWQQALKIFNQIQKPVIVKPRTGSRGRHTTTYIYTEEELKKAFYVAKQLCFWVLVEEQLFGPVYRGTVINYKTEGVLRGDSPQVIGNGISTIEELVVSRNYALHEGTSDILLDDRAAVYLLRQKLNFETVPAIGTRITLSEKIGVSYGGSSSEDYSICHPDTIELFANAGKVVGDPIVGFDFIIQDIAKSYKEQRCGFIEANTLPFINLHHDPLVGTPRNVAAAVWDLMEVR
jgi:D-alanine-D-alanine ligase-like ATP-grasp enzyme